MKRSFKAATVFTGAAACTAALAPMAHAATAAVTPNITGHTCAGGTTEALVLTYTPAEEHSPACFSGTGGPVTVGGDPVFSSYCGGEWKGFLWIGGTPNAFTGGTHNLFKQHVSKVEITGTNSDPGSCTG